VDQQIVAAFVERWRISASACPAGFAERKEPISCRSGNGKAGRLRGDIDRMARGTPGPV
jgi:hypothetical protein